MHKALHLRYDIGRLYVSKKEGGRGFTSIEDCVDRIQYKYSRTILRRAKKD